MRIGILGSACNPPHNDHLRIGDWAKKELLLDKIIFIPTGTPPHKDPPAVAPEIRLEMGTRAIQGKSGWEISDIELSRSGKSYTEDTIKEFQRRYSHDEIFYIMGADSLVSMPWKWKGGYGLLDLCTFIIAPRRGYPLDSVPRRILKKVRVLQKPETNTSSTEIRKLLAEGKEVSHLLPGAVYAYIKENGIYSPSTS